MVINLQTFRRLTSHLVY